MALQSRGKANTILAPIRSVHNHASIFSRKSHKKKPYCDGDCFGFRVDDGPLGN